MRKNRFSSSINLPIFKALKQKLKLSSCCDVINVCHVDAGEITLATRAMMVNPKTGDICKTRRVRGLEIILLERTINFT